MGWKKLFLFCFVFTFVSHADETPTAEKLAQWIADLGDNSYRKREAANKALFEAGEAAVPALKAALQDPDYERRTRAQFILGPESFTHAWLDVLVLLAQEGRARAASAQSAMAAVYGAASSETLAAYPKNQRIFNETFERPAPLLKSSFTEPFPNKDAREPSRKAQADRNAAREALVKPFLQDLESKGYKIGAKKADDQWPFVVNGKTFLLSYDDTNRLQVTLDSPPSVSLLDLTSQLCPQNGRKWPQFAEGGKPITQEMKATFSVVVEWQPSLDAETATVFKFMGGSSTYVDVVDVARQILESVFIVEPGKLMVPAVEARKVLGITNSRATLREYDY